MKEFKDVEELNAVKFTDENGTHVFTEEDEVICVANDEVYVGRLNSIIDNESGQMITIKMNENEYPIKVTIVGIFTKDVTYFSRKMNTVCKHANVKVKSPHKIRKTYGSMLLDDGLAESLIMSQMGHTNIKTTKEHYYRNRRNVEQIREELDRVSEF